MQKYIMMLKIIISVATLYDISALYHVIRLMYFPKIWSGKCDKTRLFRYSSSVQPFDVYINLQDDCGHVHHPGKGGLIGIYYQCQPINESNQSTKSEQIYYLWDML